MFQRRVDFVDLKMTEIAYFIVISKLPISAVIVKCVFSPFNNLD